MRLITRVNLNAEPTKKQRFQSLFSTQKSYGKYWGTQGSLPDLESVSWYTEGREEKLGKSGLRVHV